ncbi:hypothetical protein V490_04220 [Pseudogymnoascus sp. VKM F-3557]|nr:hypothetical protein V490_04220 [Pseudogymnoascus sp. VKM F-3557]
MQNDPKAKRSKSKTTEKQNDPNPERLKSKTNGPKPERLETKTTQNQNQNDPKPERSNTIKPSVRKFHPRLQSGRTSTAIPRDITTLAALVSTVLHQELGANLPGEPPLILAKGFHLDEAMEQSKENADG